jgi:hypothetical protein
MENSPMTTLSPHDRRYISRHYREFDPELDDMGSMGPAFRAEIEARLGHVTHRSRHRIRATDYDWQRINAWMTASRMSNTSLAYLMGCSAGSIANIRCGYYTKSELVERIFALMAECGE